MFLRIYVLALMGYFSVVVAYSFYKENVGTKPLAVKSFPKITIKSHLGEYKTINDYKGKTILVDFWFSACPPCLDEMKYFPELLGRYDDLVIMSFSIDSESHTLKLLEEKPKPWNFIVKDNPRWSFYNVNRMEQNGYVDLLKVESFPTYFLIDKEGTIISAPKSAIYSVEKELGGLASLRLSFKNHLDEFNIKKVLKAFVLFNLIAGIVLLGIFFVKRDLLKRYISD